MTKKELKKNKVGKKHTNSIEIKIDYDKGSSTPNGIRIHKDCTMLDAIVATMRMWDVVFDEAKAQGKYVTSFIVNCARAYAEQLETTEE